MISDKSRAHVSEFVKEFRNYLPYVFNFRETKLTKDFIALDIDSAFIKLLKLKRTGTTYSVEFFTSDRTPVGAVVGDEIKNYSAIADILKRGFEKSDGSSKDIALSIPRSSAIVKNILMDKRLSSEEIHSKVWIEVNRLFPNLANEIYLDYVIVGPSAKDSNQIELLLVACRKEQLKPYLDILRQAHLTPKMVDINSYALERSLLVIANQVKELKTIALINISYTLIDLIVVTEGNLVYTHELNYDGAALLRQIRKNDDNTYSPLNPDALKQYLSLHLRHVMQFFYSSRPNVRIERIYISGDCVATIPNLSSYIQSEVGKETVLANPFSDMQFEPNVDKEKLTCYAPAFMLCCGLAMSTLN